MFFNCCRKTTFGTDGDTSMVAYAAVPEYYTRQSDDISWVFNFGMEDLHGYINCRLMWDPDYDVDKGVREFCRIYYGAAGEPMAAYVLKMQTHDSYSRSRMGNDLSLLVHSPKDHPLRGPAYHRFFGLTEEIGLDTDIRLAEIGTQSLDELKLRFAKDR